MGVLKGSNADGVQLMGVDGKLVSVAKSDIKEQTGNTVSLMPEGLFANVSREEFTDLIEYLTIEKKK